MGQSGQTDTVVRLHAQHADRRCTGRPEAGVDQRELRRRTTSSVASLVGSPPAAELTSSCTHGLEAAATVLGIGPGDEVIVPAFTFPSSANAFLLGGARVRFADVDPSTGNLDPRSVERLTCRSTRAVVAVHYAGVACDMRALGALQQDAGWTLVEDAAHGLFGSFDGVALGRFGDLGCLSFHRTKNISSFEGGAIIVNSADLVDRVQIALDKGTNRAEFEAGLTPSYEWAGPGSSWRMSDPMVELLADQLAERHSIQARRHEVWAAYLDGLSGWAEHVGAQLPHVPDGALHPAHIFWVLLPDTMDRATVVGRCADDGIEVARHYGSLPESRYGRLIADPDDRCPVAGTFAAQLVRLPLHHELTDREVDRVIDAVSRLASR